MKYISAYHESVLSFGFTTVINICIIYECRYTHMNTCKILENNELSFSFQTLFNRIWWLESGNVT